MLTHRNFTPQPFGFRAPLLLELVIAWITFLPALLPAQSNPLTIQPSTGRVGVGTTNPAYPLDVSGNPTQRFYWEVKAVRADVAPLVVEKEKTVENMKLAESTK